MDEILPWSDSFAIGHAGLDVEHRRLVKLINEIGATVAAKRDGEVVVNLIDELRCAAGQHIRHENAILWEIQSGAYEPWKERMHSAPFLKAMGQLAFEAHMREHEAMLGTFNAIVAGPADNLGEGLKGWFLDHVHGYETHLRSLFQAAA